MIWPAVVARDGEAVTIYSDSPGQTPCSSTALTYTSLISASEPEMLNIDFSSAVNLTCFTVEFNTEAYPVSVSVYLGGSTPYQTIYEFEFPAVTTTGGTKE